MAYIEGLSAFLQKMQIMKTENDDMPERIQAGGRAYADCFDVQKADI